MTPVLYKAVFGEHSEPTTSNLAELSKSVAVLPENIFKVMMLHYKDGISSKVIAGETGASIQLVETWLKSGVKLLQAFYGVSSE